MFEFLSSLVRHHGNPYPQGDNTFACWRLNFGLFAIFYQVTWMIDHNVEHIDFYLLGKNIHSLVFEYEEIPF